MDAGGAGSRGPVDGGSGRVIVIAHRGSSAAAPENTLAALEQAAGDGADAAEVDARAAADGEVILLHDPDLRRTAGLGRAARDLTCDDLRALDAGGWFSPAFRGERIPTLREAVRAAGDRLGLFVELKDDGDPRLADAVVDVLRKERFLHRAVLLTFHRSQLRRVREIEPALPVGLLLDREEALSGDDPDLVGFSERAATDRAVAAMRRTGRGVLVFTVNDPAEMARRVEQGVSGIITDHPARLRRVLAERAAPSDAARPPLRFRHRPRR